MSDTNQSFNPESFVREAYAVVERMDLEGWKSLFAGDGVFIDESIRSGNRMDAPCADIWE
jgi:ketosteroid isomerase-like protein